MIRTVQKAVFGTIVVTLLFAQASCTIGPNKRDQVSVTEYKVSGFAENPKGSSETATNNDGPNILFILIDDQRNDSLGCAGHPIVKTPAIDTLAKDGVHFVNAFVTTSICAASRASILTGLYERNHGYTFGHPPICDSDVKNSYPAMLRNSGYRTGLIGKFGVRTENKGEQVMFDFFRPIDRNPYFKIQADGSARHETDLIGDQAIEFIKTNPKGQPFCLSLSFNGAHAEDGDKSNHFPWPQSVDGLYEDVHIPEPRLGAQGIYDAHPDFMKASKNRSRYFWRWDTPEKYQRNMKAYYRMLTGIDLTVQRIRDELRRKKLDENTVIICMGDNGYYMGDRGFAGKWSHYDQSLRVPLIIFDPREGKTVRGVKAEEMTLNVDVAATIVDLANVSTPENYQGKSLMPIVEGRQSTDWRSDFFCEHLMDRTGIPKWEGVRGERYVYARYFEQQPVYEYLHDLKVDPDELVNLVGSEKYASVLEEMRERTSVLAQELKKTE